jgi:hypothetical protein
LKRPRNSFALHHSAVGHSKKRELSSIFVTGRPRAN